MLVSLATLVVTKVTIGYGTRSIKRDCIEAVLVWGLQTVVGLLLDVFLAGFVLERLIHGTKRKEEIRRNTIDSTAIPMIPSPINLNQIYPQVDPNSLNQSREVMNDLRSTITSDQL